MDATIDPSVEVYEYADSLAALEKSRTRPSTLVRLLMDKAAPFLPDDSIKDTESRDSTVALVLDLRYRLRQKFKTVLQQEGVWDSLKDKLGWSEEKDTDVLPTVEEIGELLLACDIGTNGEAHNLRDRVRISLNEARDSLTADLIARFGFLDLGEHISGAGLSSEAPTFDEMMPDWFTQIAGGLQDGPEKLIANMSADGSRKKRKITKSQHAEIPELFSLKNWQRNTHESFTLCVKQAYDLLKDLRKGMAGKSIYPQKLEMSEDLESKSAVELLEIYLSNGAELRRRFEAMLILWFAIGLFSIKNHPIYKTQLSVHNDIRSIFNHTVWPFAIEYGSEPIKRRATRHGPVYEHPVSATQRANDAGHHRSINKKISSILDGANRRVRLIRDTEHMAYTSRTKTDQSILIKMLLIQERVREALALMNGGLFVPDLNEADAQKIINEKEKAMKKHHPDIDLGTKQSAFELNEDNAGITLGIPLTKKLDDFDDDDKSDLDLALINLMAHLTRELKLTDTHIINNLWKNSEAEGRVRPNRSSKFRECKLTGVREVEINGKIVRVACEIQIQPIEVFALARSPGDPASMINHAARKRKDIGRITAPERINGTTVYPRFDARNKEFAAAFARVAS